MKTVIQGRNVEITDRLRGYVERKVNRLTRYLPTIDEARMELTGPTHPDDPPFTGGQLLALVDALRAGTLNDAQRETVQALRQGILALVEQEAESV